MSEQKFTGERFIPGHGGVQLAYEHVHRYLFALSLAAGKQVLDVASGSGYGSGLLAKVAERVWAIDVDGPAVRSARDSVRDANVSFVNADGSRLPFPAGVMDLVLAFEVIEHVPDQQEMVREIARVLRPGGTALISTPDKAEYSDARNYVNPFHLRELYREEFLELLRPAFASVRLLQQQVRAGSLISDDGNSAHTGTILSEPLPGEEHAGKRPMYLLACCSCRPMDGPPNSAYFDLADSLFRESTAEFERLNQEIRRLGEWAQELDELVTDKDQSIRKLQENMTLELNSRDETVRGLQAELRSEVGRRDRLIKDLQEKLNAEVSQRDEEIRRLSEDFEERTKWALSLEENVRSREENLQRIREALLYRLFRRLRLLPE